MIYDQDEFDARCEWGAPGLAALAPASDVVILVDVLSFSTSVEIATSRGATVLPYSESGPRAAEFAAQHKARLASELRDKMSYSLSPASLLNIQPGTRLVLPSLNGARLSLLATHKPTLCGCLRNARAVARAAQSYGRRVAVIPAGERWKESGELRPAFEDLIGAGAIIQHLAGSLSPEANAALAAFRQVEADLQAWLAACSSGKELLARGYGEDVALAAQLEVSVCVPAFDGSQYVQWVDGR